MEITISIKDYKKMKRIIRKDKEDYHYKVDFPIKDYPYDTKEFWLIKIVEALNIKDIEKRYTYIYEEMCNILDNISHKVCDFKCDKCYGNRSGKCFATINGCCYFHKKPCPYLVNSVCQHRSISCKIFICEPVEKKYKFKSKIETYPLLNWFFNNKQKDIIHYSYRQTVDMVIPKLMDAR